MMSLFLSLYLKGKKNVRVFFIIFFKSIHKNYLLKNNSQLFLRTKLWLFGNTKLFILLVVSYNTLKTKKQKKTQIYFKTQRQVSFHYFQNKLDLKV